MSCSEDAEPGRPVPSGRGERAVVILATGEAAALADRLRKRFDPEWFERVPPHVSLLGPCDIGEADEVVASRLEAAISGVPPFFIRLGAPEAFVVPSLVLYLGIENGPPVCELASSVRRTLPSCGAGLPFKAHLTVGRFASGQALASALQEIKKELARRGPEAEPFGFPAEEVHLFKEDPETGVYSSAARVRLEG